jgi:hypothetical protein
VLQDPVKNTINTKTGSISRLIKRERFIFVFDIDSEGLNVCALNN